MADGGSCRVLLVRHGETTWNKDRLLQGQEDTHLSDRGREQAVCVGARLRDDFAGCSAVYASDLSRARDTAAEAAKALRLPLPSERLLPALRERNLGVLQGKRRDDPDVIARRAAAEIPGAEMTDEVRRRAVAAVEQIASSHLGAVVVVVAHGGVITELFAFATEGQKNPPPPPHIPNASISVVTLRKEGEGFEWEVGQFGDASHCEVSKGTDGDFA